MTPMTIAATAAVAVTALLVGTTNTLKSPAPAPAASAARQAGAPTTGIDVLELMGRALGELPVEQADTN